MAYAPHLAIALTGEVHFDRRIDRHESLERVQHARVVRVLAGTQANRRIVAREVVELAGADQHGRVHLPGNAAPQEIDHAVARSEEHTSELQSPDHLVCRLLLEKKKSKYTYAKRTTLRTHRNAA